VTTTLQNPPLGITLLQPKVRTRNFNLTDNLTKLVVALVNNQIPQYLTVRFLPKTLSLISSGTNQSEDCRRETLQVRGRDATARPQWHFDCNRSQNTRLRCSRDHCFYWFNCGFLLSSLYASHLFNQSCRTIAPLPFSVRTDIYYKLNTPWRSVVLCIYCIYDDSVFITVN
jgi:hypothetical protein